MRKQITFIELLMKYKEVVDNWNEARKENTRLFLDNDKLKSENQRLKNRD